MIRDIEKYNSIISFLKEHTLKEGAKKFNMNYKALHAFCKKYNIYFLKESKKGVNNPAYKHGLEGSRLCSIYRNMLARCSNPNRKDFKFYGGRGITVCELWRKDSSSFFTWAKESGYSEDLTLGRINVDENYSPENCRWITVKEQCRNRRSNTRLTLKGETKTLVEWAEQLDIKYDTLRKLIRTKSLEEIVKCMRF